MYIYCKYVQTEQRLRPEFGVRTCDPPPVDGLDGLDVERVHGLRQRLIEGAEASREQLAQLGAFR